MSHSSAKIWSFFDLDGTLINKDSYLYFLLKWKIKNPQRLLPLFYLPIKYALYLSAQRDRAYIKEAFLSAFMKGAKRIEVAQFVSSFWDEFLPKYQNKAVVKRLYWHHKNNHSVYIVTASLDIYANYLKKIWPVDDVISTKAEWCGDILTGKLNGKNCKGKEKTVRIKKELKIDLQKDTYYAYTDSYTDFPLLEYATYPIIVKSSKLTRFNSFQRN